MSLSKPTRLRKKHPAGPADLQPGERRIVEIAKKSIGIFNVKGEYYALHNRCPHMGGKLCEGPVTGTTIPAGPFEYTYGRQDEILRCGWHGWEFEISSGRCLVDEKLRARAYAVTVEAGVLMVHI